MTGKKRTRLMAGIAMTASLLLGANAAQAGPWQRAESAHFIVYSGYPAEKTKEHVATLETYRYMLSLFYGLSEDDENSAKQLIYLVGNTEDMHTTLPGLTDQAAGYFNESCPIDQVAVAVYGGTFGTEALKRAGEDRILKQPENISQTILFHEYAHSFMFHHSEINYPPWFVEGFADFYGPTRIAGNTVAVGVPPIFRSYTLSYGGGMSYAELLRSSKAVWENTPQKSQDFYAQSWVLTHYLMSDEGRRSKLNAFFEAYNNGTDAVAAFETTFGIKVDDLHDLIAAYMKNQLKATVYSIKDIPATASTIVTLPASSHRLALLDAATRNCPQPKYAPKVLADIREEAAKYPGDDYASLVLARAEDVLGDEEKALDFLKTYTAAHPDDAAAQYLLGLTWYLMTEHSKINAGETADSQMAHAREAFVRAYKLDDHNAPNLYYLSLAQKGLPGYPNQTAVDAAIQAHMLTPAVPTYALRAAELLAQTDRLAEARMMLVPLASNPHAPARSAWARAIVAAIDAGKGKDEVLKMLGTPLGKDDD